MTTPLLTTPVQAPDLSLNSGDEVISPSVMHLFNYSPKIPIKNISPVIE